MTERPILFSGAMVRALMAGTKTQTRRIAKRVVAVHAVSGVPLAALDSAGPRVPCPYGQPGDRLWVRETWAKWGIDHDCGEGPSRTEEPIYRADGDPWDERDKWRPSIHMPRTACRLVLEITEVRIERLQAISEADARAEGIDLDALAESQDRYDMVADQNMTGRPTAVGAFRGLWLSINGLESWEANPWVWAVSFKSHHPR